MRGLAFESPYHLSPSGGTDGGEGSGLLASASDDRTLRLWDAATGEPLLTLPGHAAIVYNVAFDEHGRLLSGSEDRTLRRWNLEIRQTLQQEACRRANRNLTRAEWTSYVGGPYRQICPELPAGE